MTEHELAAAVPVAQLPARSPQDRTLIYLTHEIRQALAPLRRSIRFVFERAQSVGSDDETLAQLAALQRQVERVQALAEQHEAFAALQQAGVPVTARRIDLALLVSQVVDDFALAEPQLTILLDAPQPVLLLAEPIHLEQILCNLLSNAVQVTPEGSIVQVRVWRERQRAWCAVTDGGPGIPPRAHEGLFQLRQPTVGSPFYAGVGLALSSTIARRYGGDLLLHSSDASGSEFRCWLPLS